jgi:hypothetical protein
MRLRAPHLERYRRSPGTPLHCTMPEKGRFLGIVIAIYYRDHAPLHFHAL